MQATLLNCICLKLKISASKCQAQAIRMFLVAAYLLNHFADRSIKDPQGISFSCQARTQVGLLKHGRCLGSESPFVCGNSNENLKYSHCFQISSEVLCFLLPVWPRTEVFKVNEKKNPVLAMKIHFSFQVTLTPFLFLSFPLKADCPALSLYFCFLHLPWTDSPEFYQKCSYQDNFTVSLFFETSF